MGASAGFQSGCSSPLCDPDPDPEPEAEPEPDDDDDDDDDDDARDDDDDFFERDLPPLDEPFLGDFFNECDFDERRLR